jgi:hypothetical protein
MRDPTKPQTEAEWQSVVVHYAKLFSWRIYHTRISFGSAKGFPDLVLVRRPRLVFVELKSDKGKVKPEQLDWLADLRASRAEAYLWRPTDVEDVVAILADTRTQQVLPPSSEIFWPRNPYLIRMFKGGAR